VEKSIRVHSGRAHQGIHDTVDQLGWVINRLAKGVWEESRRRQAQELADRLVAACTRARLRRAARAARALQSLMKLAPEDVHSIKETFTFKLFELLGLVRVLTDADSEAGSPRRVLPPAADSSKIASRSLRTAP
jgi:GAF domain-containing protein